MNLSLQKGVVLEKAENIDSHSDISSVVRETLGTVKYLKSDTSQLIDLI